MPEVEAVQYTLLQEVEEIQPEQWPPGGVYLDALARAGIARPPPPGDDAAYWQACARWALLTKYGYLKDHPNVRRSDVDFIQTMAAVWRAAAEPQKSPPNMAADGTTQASTTTTNDLVELLQGARSNNRKVRFALMLCQPGTQFNLHAHPTLELVYCARGALHEVRMEGAPPVAAKDLRPHPTIAGRLQGPNLSLLSRAWKFGSLQEGEWLVNEAGSIHKSFTAQAQGCVLVALWGGAHADVPAGGEPRDPPIQGAVDVMEERLSSCVCASDWRKIAQTFLPASERRLP